MGTGTCTDLPALLGRKLADRTLDLPMLPAVAAEVLGLVQQETTDAAKLSAAIHREPALASNVLRVANSPTYVGQVACASLQQAVSRLGMQLITEIALAVSVRSKLFADAQSADLFAQLWRHSVVTGFYTKEIARTRRRNVELAFLCGLLHDIGKAALLANAERLLPDGSVANADLALALHEHHGAAGAELASRWRLPEAITVCILHHHDYSQARTFQDIAMTVSLADLLAHMVTGTGPGGPPSADAIRKLPVLQALNLYPDQLDELFDKAGRAVAAAEGMR